MTGLASITQNNFTGRNGAEAVAGLLTVTDFHSFTLAYVRQINANLSVTGTIGLVGVTSGFTLGLPKSLLPIYTLSATWALTPKLTLNASAAKTVSPPTTIIANAQTSYDASVNLSYQLTPKITLVTGGTIDYSNATFTSGVAEVGFSPFLTSTQKTYGVNAGLSYSMTPFLSAGLNASYTERVGGGFITPDDVVTVSLNYRPY